MRSRVLMALLGFAFGLAPGLASADQFGPVLSPEMFDQCALNAGGDPLPYSDMTAECQQVFAPCHVRLGQQDPLLTPDRNYESAAGAELEQCLSRDAEAILALLDASHGDVLSLQTDEGAAPASWLIALPYQTSARAGALCGQEHDGGSLMGYLQCLNGAWLVQVNEMRGFLAEMAQ